MDPTRIIGEVKYQDVDEAYGMNEGVYSKGEVMQVEKNDL